MQKFIPDNIAKYDDGYTATAFGDNFTAWGTPVILIETGALAGKDEMYLVRLNFVAFMTALHVMADGSEKAMATDAYDHLVANSSGLLYHVIFRGANIVDPVTGEVSHADIAINTERRRASFPAPNYIREIGDLSGVYGTEEYFTDGFNVVPRFTAIKVGELAEFMFYKRDRNIDWKTPDLETQFPPDAIFSSGRWIKGDRVVPRKP